MYADDIYRMLLLIVCLFIMPDFYEQLLHQFSIFSPESSCNQTVIISYLVHHKLVAGILYLIMQSTAFDDTRCAAFFPLDHKSIRHRTGKRLPVLYVRMPIV